MSSIIEVEGSVSNYEVDTVKVTCTCRDFQYRRSNYDLTNPSRLCKHLKSVEDKLTYGRVDEKVRIRWDSADMFRKKLEVKFLKPYLSLIDNMEYCGSYRRKCPTVSDLDILYTLKDENRTLDMLYDDLNFEGYTCRWRGDKKATFMFENVFQIDFKLVPKESWWFAVLHYTGSKNSNIELRRVAKSKGLTLNEYGLYDDENKCIINPTCEKDIYDALGMEYVEPQNRI